MISRYSVFAFGAASCRVPYFNNKTTKSRAALRVRIGKGSTDDIAEELREITTKEHIDADTMSDTRLRSIMEERGIGIECSGFAFHVLAAECIARKIGALEKQISFINCKGLMGKLRCALRPVENCDVATFAADENSHAVSLSDAKPGDIITMIGNKEESERDHVLVIYSIENGTSKKLFYAHSVAYPEDGTSGTGVRKGTIEIIDANKPLYEQRWSEEGTPETLARIIVRAKKSVTSLRRLNFF